MEEKVYLGLRFQRNKSWSWENRRMTVSWQRGWQEQAVKAQGECQHRAEGGRTWPERPLPVCSSSRRLHHPGLPRQCIMEPSVLTSWTVETAAVCCHSSSTEAEQRSCNSRECVVCQTSNNTPRVTKTFASL